MSSQRTVDVQVNTQSMWAVSAVNAITQCAVSVQSVYHGERNIVIREDECPNDQHDQNELPPQPISSLNALQPHKN